MDPGSGRTTVRAIVPESELYKYAATLRSLTQGRAHHTRKLAGYEAAPDHIAQRVKQDRQSGEESKSA
jgi:elongation factor G